MPKKWNCHQKDEATRQSVEAVQVRHGGQATNYVLILFCFWQILRSVCMSACLFNSAINEVGNRTHHLMCLLCSSGRHDYVVKLQVLRMPSAPQKQGVTDRLNGCARAEEPAIACVVSYFSMESLRTKHGDSKTTVFRAGCRRSQKV